MITSLATIRSLVTTLLPDVSQDSQLDELIAQIIHFQHNSHDTSAHNEPEVDATQHTYAMEASVVRRDRHRRNERIRHNKIVELIRQLSHMIGLSDRNETRTNILDRSARYVLFLELVIDKLEADGTDDTALSDDWVKSLEPLYYKACVKAKELLEQVGQHSSEPLLENNLSINVCH
ncbi:unnamed protein product [Medioppia subpectinata]|uniref:BHLH domain-containing protein n=1 Tax=Medioppia subpectinata TaxID=1979941 RepID=A0A7R9KEC5_9ACAR|nr:unnamed protein product [Medioppia subpectinata]CAG2101026.1 unnamed protein product [Medioppia subpectinata]